MGRFSLSLPPPTAIADLTERSTSTFSKLSLESAGSPAPWRTAAAASPPLELLDGALSSSASSSLPPTPLRVRVLLTALSSLSLALTSSAEQRLILSTALSRAEGAVKAQEGAVREAKAAVLAASRGAQEKHREARSAEGRVRRAREACGREVERVEEAVWARLAEGAGEDGPLDRRRGVDAVAAAVGLSAEEVDALVDPPKQQEDEGENPLDGLELDAEWAAVEEDLIQTLAARVLADPAVLAAWRERAGEGGENGGEADGKFDRVSLPPTPPASVRSAEFDVDDEEGDVAALSPAAEEDVEADPPLPSSALFSHLLSLVHPPLLALFRLSFALSTALSAALGDFESLVALSAAAVDTHQAALSKLAKARGKLRDLKDLERREREEEERMGREELRPVVVELAKVVLGRLEEEEEEETVEDDEEQADEDEEEDD
ncbi:hypothetical protein JCM8097_002434 [Rhodosporidiobolus ruineniae]